MSRSMSFFNIAFIIGVALFLAVPVASGQYAMPLGESKGEDPIKVVSVETNKKDQQLMISLNHPTPTEGSISLFNLNGMEVQRKKLAQNKELVKLDLTDLPEGMYIAVINGEEMYLSQYVFKEF